MSFDLLRCHVGNRPHDRAGVGQCALGRVARHFFVAFLKFRQTKVQKLHAVARQHDIAGFQISVYHAVTMRVVQRVGDLDGGAQGERHRQRAILQSPRQGGTLEIFHDEEDVRSVLTDVMECADIRVRDARDGARFVPEPFDPAAWRVHEVAWEQLDGDGPIESRIARAKNFTHPTGAKRCQDLEWAETGSRGEPHMRRQSIAMAIKILSPTLHSVSRAAQSRSTTHCS